LDTNRVTSPWLFPSPTVHLFLPFPPSVSKSSSSGRWPISRVTVYSPHPLSVFPFMMWTIVYAKRFRSRLFMQVT
jgi:hypothetical protein